MRVVGSESSSECFFFHREDRGTLLKLDVVSLLVQTISSSTCDAAVTCASACFCLQCGGIILNVNGSNHSTVISFSDYYEGAAPALLVNHTAWATIAYSQRSAVSLSPSDLWMLLFKPNL